jgi:hypothetical protein
VYVVEPSTRSPSRNMTTAVIIGRVLPEASVEVTESCLRSTVHLTPTCALITSRT